MPDTRLVYVVGATHSGSTALSYVLGNQPELLAVSQLEEIELAARPKSPNRCTCGQPVADCAFWQQVAAEYSRQTGESIGPD